MDRSLRRPHTLEGSAVPHAPFSCWALAALTFVPGCVGIGTAAPLPEPVPADAARAVVFLADGAGGFQAASRSLRQVVHDEELPLRVEPVVWTHGYCRIVADQVHQSHMKMEARRLADRVRSWETTRPGQPVYLVGHSAGCALVLMAAELLPPASVERIVLLAPAVSADYDLRPALSCACRGVDVFYSERDWGYLGLGVWLTGTADRHWSPAAGRVGFRPAVSSPEDAALFGKLRQYPWNPSLTWTGNRGGHYGPYQPQFLRACVLPLLLAPLNLAGGGVGSAGE
jgi:pimeloyl-ACP methyl ester carboxylesterase